MLPLRSQSRWDENIAMTKRMHSIQSSMPFILSLLAEAKPLVKKNAEALMYLEFIAKLDLWFAKKIVTQEKVKQQCADVSAGANRDSVATLVATECGDVLRDLAERRSDFEKLWLLTNKPAGLEYIMMRYDRQAAYWQEKIEQVKRGEFSVDLVLESSWIYHPKGNPGVKDTTQVQKACFRKTFATPKGVCGATLQIIGDTYAKVNVNGKSLGEVYVRPSLSLSIEHQRIKMFNILPLLSDSSNVIAVEAQAFSPTGSAGINVYAELQLPDGSVRKILSDGTWKVTDTSAPNWTTTSYDDSSWVSAAVKVYPFTVVRPNFATGRSSWIER